MVYAVHQIHRTNLWNNFKCVPFDQHHAIFLTPDSGNDQPLLLSSMLWSDLWNCHCLCLADITWYNAFHIPHIVDYITFRTPCCCKLRACSSHLKVYVDQFLFTSLNVYFFLKIPIILLTTLWKLILSKQTLAKRLHPFLSKKGNTKPGPFCTVASISTNQNKFSMTKIQFNQENKSFQL